MHVQRHHDLAGFADLTAAMLAADPVRHTVALSVLDALQRAPTPDRPPPVLLSVHQGAALVGAAVRTPPQVLMCSALPQTTADAVVGALAELDPDLPGFTGPTAVVDALVERAGRPVLAETVLRLFTLGRLVDPRGVRGQARAAGPADAEALGTWVDAFAAEARASIPRNGTDVVRQWVATGAGAWVWEVDGAVVSLAKAGPPAAGMSRIGPVYTPAAHRGHGYAAAVTAAASRWALAAGARHVVLFTDLANPTSNRPCPRVGFVPVGDHREVWFTQPT